MDINCMADLVRAAQNPQTDWRTLGDINVVRHPQQPWLLFNYTDAATYAGRWNWLERQSRGLIVNLETGEVVCWPMAKFFNWMQHGFLPARGAYITDVTEKLDGSLGNLYRMDGQYAIATRGRFDSPQALWATEYLQNYDLNGLDPSLTLCFEMIYPENRRLTPLVVNYGERRSLVLLAAKNRCTGEELPFYAENGVLGLAEKFGFDLPRTMTFNNVGEILALTGEWESNFEGVVVRYSDGTRWKFKGDRYLEMARLISNLTWKNTVAAVRNNAVEAAGRMLPDEFHAQFRAWVDEINTEFLSDLAQAQIFAAEAAKRVTRKEQAIYINTHAGRLAPAAFFLLNGQSPREFLMDKILERGSVYG